MQQKLFQKFLSQAAGASGKTEKESQKPPPKMKKIFIKYLQRIFVLPGCASSQYTIQRFTIQ